MTITRLLLFALCFLTASLSLSAQDIHFSMFDMSPLTLNPANTGAFSGTVRLGAIHRGQWYQADPDFTTTALYADSPILALGKKKRDWLGVGVSIYQDRAGRELDDARNMRIGGIENNALFPSVAFHKVLDKEGNNILTIGAQGGGASRRLFLDPRIFTQQNIDSTWAVGGGGQPEGSNEFLEGRQVQTTDGGERFIEASYTEYSLGVLLSSKLSEGSNFTLGASLGHLVTLGEYNLARDTTRTSQGRLRIAQRPTILRVHTTYSQNITDKWSVQPMAFFQTTRGLSELILQTHVGYQFNDDFRFNGGLGYRIGDAAMLIGGINYKDWRVGLSYDLTLGQVAQAGFQNAFEVGASYIIKLYQDPVIDPVILCPEF